MPDPAAEAMTRLHAMPDGFVLSLRGAVVMRHAAGAPCLFAGRGRETMAMYRGNFDISDYLEERAPLADVTVEASGDGAMLHFRRWPGDAVQITLELEAGRADDATLHVRQAAPGINRLWFRLPAEDGEHVWGCGEQMSYFDLRGRRFPLWTSEPGVGRDKSTEITWRADATGRAGGDYYTTNYPQPSFLTSRRLFVHLQTTAYAAFDFRAADFYELEVWAVPERLELRARPDFRALVRAVADRFGRQPTLPDWLYAGAVIGLKAGDASFDRLETYLTAGVQVAGLWCEDWAGVRTTSFGTRLFWDWRWSQARYPGLDRRIAALRARGIRFLGYVNPYLCVDGTLFPEAERLGHLARDAAGGSFLVDFGEFDCGVVDFTSEAAREWFKQRILRENMLDFGLSGWMADFGEYLPLGVQLADGSDSRLMHNAWPTLWAEVNAAAIAEAGQTGEALFFMRAGYTGVQGACPMLWGGDQSVDFSRHDGLQTVISAALSAGLMGNAYHHSDIGGYTSLFGNVRTAELLQRWAEMAAFTPMMRTHEGNRPGENLQVDGDPVVLAHFARMTRVWRHLAPYLRRLSEIAASEGLPVQRPLFLHHEDDPATYAIQDQYLYGPDLLVAPVHCAGATEWRVYLPAGAAWMHVWSGAAHAGGAHVTVAAPLGQPPVFARVGSEFSAVFAGLRDL